MYWAALGVDAILALAVAILAITGLLHVWRRRRSGRSELS